MRHLHILLLFAIFLCTRQISFAQPAQQQIRTDKQQILFFENKGQLFTSTGKKADDVLYSATTPSFSIYIYRDGLSYQFTQEKKSKPADHKNTIISDEETELQSALKSHRVDIQFKNANPSAVVLAEQKADYVEHYYNPAFPQGIRDIAAFEKIVVTNIYPGIDWVLYSSNRHVKYEFIVHPHADASAIQMQVMHADDVIRMSDSEIQITTRLGKINDRNLLAFEKESAAPVPVKFDVDHNTISFHLNTYNHDHTLIIDPEVIWSTYYGGEFEDAVNSMHLTADGYLYITGYTRSETMMAGSGFDNLYNGGTFDMYCAKLDTLGNKIWGTYFGGNNGDFGTAVCADETNGVYISGFTLSLNFPTTPGAFQEVMAGAYDAFIVKLNTAGNLQWSTCFGGNSSDFSRSITVDHAGYVYLAGSSYSGMMAYNGYQNIKGGDNDQILAKFSPEGDRIWSTYLGGERDDFSRGVAVDSDNNIFIAGYSESMGGLAHGGFDTVWAGKYDATLAKFDSSGDLLWSTYYGGIAEDNGNAVAVDENGNSYLAIQSGTTNGLGFNGYKNSGGGGMDAVLVKFDPQGNRKWSTYYGGTAEDMGKAVCVIGNFVYLAGHTYSLNHINYYGFQPTLTGWSDALLAKFDTTGNFYWASYAGGFDIEYGRSVVARNPYSVYHGGKTFSFTFPTTPGAFQQTFGGDPADGFIQKISDCPGAVIFYADDDNDGYGNTSSSILSCDISVTGYVNNNNDCNDANHFIHPAANETCNTIDDNCNGLTDDEDEMITGTPVWYYDNDGDLFGDDTNTTEACIVPDSYVASGGDCNDENNSINPDATELCNGIDDDCDELIDDDVVFITYYADIDLDGYGNSFSTISSCTGIPPGYAETGGDCNDTNPSIHPFATEICNSLDDDCDVFIDENVIVSSITPSGPISFCKGGSLILFANTGAGYHFQWKRNGANIPGATSFSLPVFKSGNYTVLITIPAGCSDLSDQTTVTIYPKPNPSINSLGSLDICATGSVKLKTAGTPGHTYQWYKDNVLILGATNNTLLAVSTGAYQVKETSALGCTKNSAPAGVISSCRESNASPIDFHIYPNPVQDQLSVFLQPGSKEEIILISIFNEIGETIYTEQHVVADGILFVHIDLPNGISNGIYVLRASTTNENYNRQFVVLK